MKLAAAALTELTDLPPVLTILEMMAVYRISQSTIRRDLQNGTFRPRPFAKYPYRWRKDDVIADINRDRDELPQRPHGFAAVGRRVRPAKAAIDRSATRRAR